MKLREPLSASGKPFARCDEHWEQRLRKQERIDRDYAPDSDVPPAWYSDLAPEDRMEPWDDEW